MSVRIFSADLMVERATPEYETPFSGLYITVYVFRKTLQKIQALHFPGAAWLTTTLPINPFMSVHWNIFKLYKKVYKSAVNSTFPLTYTGKLHKGKLEMARRLAMQKTYLRLWPGLKTNSLWISSPIYTSRDLPRHVCLDE